MGGPFVRAVATFGFIGLIPFAPATWASLVTLLLWVLLPPAPALAFAAIGILVFVLGTYTAHRAESLYGHDDGRVVIDEVAGSLLAVAAFPPRLGLAIAAFLLFRLFDIVKPPPIYQLQAFPGGLGVMADDLAAGLATNLVLRLGLFAIPGLAEILL